MKQPEHIFDGVSDGAAFVVPVPDCDPLSSDNPNPILELFPIPAAVLCMHDGRLLIQAANKSFRGLGLYRENQSTEKLRPIVDELLEFVESKELHFQFQWEQCDDVESRYFTVDLARRELAVVEGRFLITLTDQTAQRRTERNLRREMMTDSLTGLPNRQGFSDLVEATLPQVGAEKLAVLAVNLNRFSRINACMGGLVGDELLITVARRIKGALRARDTLSRTGGDEFAILIRLDAGAEDALHVAHRIENALAAPFRLSDFEVKISCSIGISLGEHSGDDGLNLIRHAQFAVRRSKKSGKIEIYSIRALDVARAQFRIETELRRALDHGEMTLNFQPIVDLSTGEIVSFESLARWTTRDGVEISPTQFIPVAEEAGLIVPLGRWAMTEAMRTLALWDKAAGGNCGISLAVNVSAIQLQRDQVATMVEHVLSTNGLSASRLTLELTESAIVADPEGAGRVFHDLKALGSRIAMDDFGTGYSNLAFLQKLPIDMLKIDKSFVSEMLIDRDKVAIVRAVLSLAQALGMSTVAEGVESRELEQTLTALGCSKGQGYLFGRPLAADDAYALLESRAH